MTFHGKFMSKKFIIKDVKESPMIMILPLIILSMGAIFSGYFFKDLLIGDESSNFWLNSIFFLETVLHDKIPLWFLLLTPVLVISAIPLSYYLYVKNKNILEKLKEKNKMLYKFLLNKWYIDEIYEFTLISPIKKIGSFFWKKIDENTIDRFGPNGISKIIKLISNKAVQFQSGYIYDYAFVMLVGLSALITYLILN